MKEDDTYARNDDYAHDTTVSYEDKSPEEIEQEIEQTRAKMSDTLNALESKFSPSQLMDQALGYFRNASSGTSEFTANLGRTVRNNPVPVALVGIGLGWLLLGGTEGFAGRRRATYPADTYPDISPYDVYSTEDVYNTDTATTAPENAESEGRLKESMEKLKASAHGAWEQAAETAQATSEQVGQAAHQARERMGQATHQARERMGQAAHQARERMGQAAHQARERVGQMAEGAQERMAKASGTVRHQAERVTAMARHKTERARQGFTQKFQEQPLVIGAVALAVGAVLGAALPPTRREDELMGRKRDELLERAEAVGKDQLHKVERVAEAAQEAAQGEAKQQASLTAEAVKEQFRQVPEKAERIVEAAKEAAKEEAKRQDLGAPLSASKEETKERV